MVNLIFRQIKKSSKSLFLQCRNKTFKLSSIVFLLLGFFALAQQNIDNQQNTEKSISIIESYLERFSIYKDSLQAQKCLDSAAILTRNIVSDSTKNFYELIIIYNRADVEREFNHNDNAEVLFKKYLENTTAKPDANLQAFTYEAYLWLGYLAKMKGRFAEAMEFYKGAIPYGDSPEWGISNTNKLIGDLFLVQNQFEIAKNYYLKAIQSFKAMPQEKDNFDKRIPQRLARCYEAMAEYHRRTQHLDSADYYLKLRRPLLQYALPVALIDAYRLDGMIASEFQKYDEAAQYYQKALDLAKANFRTQFAAEIFQRRGEIMLKQQKYSAAICDFDSAIVRLSKNGKIIFKYEYATILALKAKVVLQSNLILDKQQLAYNLLKNSLLLSDSISADYSTERDRQAQYALQRETFENGIATAFELFQQTKDPAYLEQALIWSDKSRSVALRHAMQLRSVTNFKGVPDSIIQKENLLKQTIASLENMMRLSNSENEISHLAQQLQHTRLSQEKLVSKIASHYPTYHQLKYQTNTLDLAETLSKTPKNRTLVEYFIASDAIYIFKIQKESKLELIKMQLTQGKLNDLVFDGLDFIKGDSEDLQTFKQNAFALHQTLIAPLQLRPEQHLVIIPDGVLGLLPFETLLTDTVSNNPLKMPYLLQQHSISYHYALSLLALQFPDKSVNGLIAFIPNFKDDPLFYQQQQADFLAKNIEDIRIFKEDNATKQHFLQNAAQFQAIHLSTHGIANDSIGDLSYLRLSNEERLYVSELYGLQLNANLVVLSACETANGEWRSGEGTVGLTLGFLYAGAKSIVSSLWNVNQNSTNQFIMSFYEKLKLEQNSSNALRAAKLHLMQQNPAFAHPKYWSAFVLIGNPDEQVSFEKSFWQKPLFWAAFFLFLFFILKYYKSILYKFKNKIL